MPYTVDVLYDGYSRMSEEGMFANCSCTLVKGPNNIIVDTMTAWDRDKIVEGEPYVIDEDVQIIPTPGHTLADVSLLVKTENEGLVAITGDLFEKKEDIADPTIWKFIAGSDNPEKQEENRNKILLLADWIIPGHGPMFKVTEAIKADAKLYSDAKPTKE